jgi:hypothetical protein
MKLSRMSLSPPCDTHNTEEKARPTGFSLFGVMHKLPFGAVGDVRGVEPICPYWINPVSSTSSEEGVT